MAIINWAFLCDYAYSNEAGKADLNGIFDKLNKDGLSTIQPQMFVALEVKMAASESIDFTAKVISPSDKELTMDNARCMAPVGGGEVIKLLNFTIPYFLRPASIVLTFLSMGFLFVLFLLLSILYRQISRC